MDRQLLEKTIKVRHELHRIAEVSGREVKTKEYLMKEREKALMEITTKDCRKGCNGCFGNKYADYCKVY